MRQRKDLKAAVKRDGINAVNSDEEISGILDEAQQEKFIQSMQAIASDYMHSWKRLFSWLSILIIYINVLALLGMVPHTRQIISLWVPRSVTLQFLISPVWLGSGWFGRTLPLVGQIISTLMIFHVISMCIRGPTTGSSRFIRTTGVVSAIAWMAISYRLLWGKHSVIMLSLPLLCLAADTYVGARDLACRGIEKLSSLKYSHKKV